MEGQHTHTRMEGHHARIEGQHTHKNRRTTHTRIEGQHTQEWKDKTQEEQEGNKSGNNIQRLAHFYQAKLALLYRFCFVFALNHLITCVYICLLLNKSI